VRTPGDAAGRFAAADRRGTNSAVPRAAIREARSCKPCPAMAAGRATASRRHGQADGQAKKDAVLNGGAAAGGGVFGRILGEDDKDAVKGAIIGGAIGTVIAAETVVGKCRSRKALRSRSISIRPSRSDFDCVFLTAGFRGGACGYTSPQARRRTLNSASRMTAPRSETSNPPSVKLP
jgi:hypothetical protein